ncbi:MAG: NADPH-dependent F420 reductase [Chloroflexi bacterium]|nr:NADPH-dependent F420 reductase [Chloroflexota bacterium]
MKPAHTTGQQNQELKINIGVVGGTGAEGVGLAVRFAAAGHNVFIGSRSEDRAIVAADEATAALEVATSVGSISGGLNSAACEMGEVIILSVPYAGQSDTLEAIRPQLAGKIVVNVIAPLRFSKGEAFAAPPAEGSAAEEAAKLCPEARWVAGFHTLPAGELKNPNTSFEADALICGDDAEAKSVILELADQMTGLRGMDAGRLSSARYLEGATALLINMNKLHRTHFSVRITGI